MTLGQPLGTSGRALCTRSELSSYINSCHAVGSFQHRRVRRLWSGQSCITNHQDGRLSDMLPMRTGPSKFESASIYTMQYLLSMSWTGLCLQNSSQRPLPSLPLFLPGLSNMSRTSDMQSRWRLFPMSLQKRVSMLCKGLYGLCMKCMVCTSYVQYASKHLQQLQPIRHAEPGSSAARSRDERLDSQTSSTGSSRSAAPIRS